MKVHAIILGDDNVEDVKKSFNSVIDCDAISVLNYTLVDGFEQFLGNNRGYHHLAKDVSFEDEINKVVREVDSDYYVVLDSGYTVNNISSAINKFYDKNKFTMVLPESGLNKLIVNSHVHNRLFGFSQKQSIIEKIKIFAENTGEQNMILKDIEVLYG